MRWGAVHRSFSARAAAARLVGAIAVAVTIVPAAVPASAGAVAAGPDDDIGDRLIQSIAGYRAAPEGGGGMGQSSGPVTAGDIAEVLGTDAADVSAGVGAGYARVFATPSGDGFAMVIGVEATDAAAALRGFRDSGEATGEEFELFPNDHTAFGEIVAFEQEAPESGPALVLTAFTSGSLAIVLGVADPHDSTAVLAAMTRDQGEITPPSAQVTSTSDEGRSTAYRLGRGLVYVVVSLAIGRLAWRAFARSRRRTRSE